jgi:hypothetical protein
MIEEENLRALPKLLQNCLVAHQAQVEVNPQRTRRNQPVIFFMMMELLWLAWQAPGLMSVFHRLGRKC